MRTSRTSFALVFTSVLAVLAAAPPRAFAACGDGIPQADELCVASPANILPGATWVRAVLSVDVDGDANLDVVAVTHDRVYVRPGTGAGLGPSVVIPFPPAAVDFRDVAAGDFDGDLDLDLAVADVQGDRVFVLRKMAGWNFAGWVTIGMGAGTDPIRVFAAPVNPDALADLVVFTAGIQSARVAFATGMGFAAGGNYPVGGTPDIALGDVDADGHVDLLYVNGMGTPTQLLARLNSYGFFGAAIPSILPLFDPLFGPLSPLALVAGDFNGDGRADAAVSTTWARLAPATSNGDGTFAFQPLGLTWAWANRLRASDVDQNGTLDVLAPHMASEVYSVQFGPGDGTFPNPYATATLPLGSNPMMDMATGDFNGDGFDDVLVANNLGVFIQRSNP